MPSRATLAQLYARLSSKLTSNALKIFLDLNFLHCLFLIEKIKLCFIQGANDFLSNKYLNGINNYTKNGFTIKYLFDSFLFTDFTLKLRFSK